MDKVNNNKKDYIIILNMNNATTSQMQYL